MTADLEARIARLEAKAAIEALMQRYAAAADAKYEASRAKRDRQAIVEAAAAQAACFAQDGEWQGGTFGGGLKGRSAIAAFFETSPWLFTSHVYSSPMIDVSGDRANATWRLVEIGIREQDGKLVLLFGTVRQTLTCVDGEWLIASMAFEKLHGAELSATPDALRCLIPLGETFS